MKQFCFLLVAVVLAGCASPSPTPTVAPATSQPLGTPQRGLAVVNSIEVFPPSGPADPARVVAHGQLPDGCTTLAGETVVRQAQTFVVTLATTRMPGAACDAAGQSFRQEIALDVAGTPAGSYVVVVNGVTGSLTLNGGAAPTPTVRSPASTLSPTVTQRASPPSPTLTPAAPTPTPPATASPQPTAAVATPTSAAANGPAACLNKAAFYGDVTVPDDTPFKQGEKFTKTWKVRNEGTCAWQGYALMFVGGDNMSAPLSTTLPAASPDTIIQVSMDFVAPARGGQQISNWEFQDAEGNRFGVGASGQGPLWVQISVVYSGQENVATPSAGNSCGASRNTGFEAQVLSLLNAQRAAAGLGAVSPQPQLAMAAAQHSFDMACNNFISHAGSDGSSWKNRVSAQGYANANSAHEIIFAGDITFGADPAGTVSWWMNDPPHHDIILNPALTQLGVAVAMSPNKPNWGYYTVDFAWP